MIRFGRMWSKWLAIVLSTLTGLWMAVDGNNVLRTGKYMGPEKPGPWANLVRAVGIDPFALGPVFVVLGLAWLAGVAGLAQGNEWGRWVLIACSVASLWYLPIGTVTSVVVLVLLVARWS